MNNLYVDKIDNKIEDSILIEVATITDSFTGLAIFITRSNKDLFKSVKNLKFFSNKKIIAFPEFESFFYEKTPVSQYVLNARIQALYNMLFAEDTIIVTTPRAILPLTINSSLLVNSVINIAKNDILDMYELSKKITQIGYKKVENVSNYGEYAVRGDIVDIANINEESGYRISFYGDNIEKIKQFSISSQISDNIAIEKIKILPPDEIIINNETIKTFQKKANGGKFYDAIISGIKVMNYIQYIPFFYQNPESFFDYIINKKFKILTTDECLSIYYTSKNSAKIKYLSIHKSNGYPEPEVLFSKYNLI